MKWSIITPCHLGNYKNAGQDRDRKLIRAVNSVMFQDTGCKIEHIVIADGCDKTVQIITDNFPDELSTGEIILKQIPKQKVFSGMVRNAGLDIATGDWICYLDSDDILNPDHIEVMNEAVNGYDWIFFNDLVYEETVGFVERTCYLKQYHCGTSNIAHKRAMKARWAKQTHYGRDDWDFIQTLQGESKNWAKVATPGYIVCHIPSKLGYDL